MKYKVLSVLCLLALLLSLCSCDISETIDDPNDPANVKAANILGKTYVSDLSKDSFVFKVLNDGSLVLSGYTGSGDTLDIPETFEGKTVVGIENKALYGNKTVKRLIIPDTVKVIGNFSLWRQ